MARDAAVVREAPRPSSAFGEVVTAVEVQKGVLEYFGPQSSRDTVLHAALATETVGREKRAAQGFDQYVMVITGRLSLNFDGETKTLAKGEGVVVKAGKSVLWTRHDDCQYVVVGVPSASSDATPPTTAVEAAASRALLSAPPLAKPPAIGGAALAESVALEGPSSERASTDKAEPEPPSTGSGGASTTSLAEAAAEASSASSAVEAEVVEAETASAAVVTEAAVEALSPGERRVVDAAAPTSEISPQFHNLPDYIQGGDALLGRATSLSAFDSLLDNPGKTELRLRLEANERPARYGARHLSTAMVVVTPEIHPFSKTGGLAMVAGSYAYEFAVRGHRTMAISPCYQDYKGISWVGNARIWLNGQHHEVNYYHKREAYGAGGKGCDYIFVDHPSYRRAAGLYGDPAQGGEYEDNLFRFALLTIAAAEAPLTISLNGSTYGQDVCFVANDWQTALLPVYLLYKYKRNGTYNKARCMLVLHNMGYQGKYRKQRYPADSFLGLPREAENELQGEDLNFGSDCINLLSAGIRLADRVLTVSPNYAQEMQTPEGGHGLHDTLREKAACGRLAGILNGISDEWNPANDPHIPTNFGPKDFESGKRACKAALQKELGLNVDPNKALVGFCGRLCFQKGVHLIADILPWVMRDEGNGVTGHVQFVLMGKGDPAYEARLRDAENSHKGSVCSYVGFDAEIEHKMMAACDLLLMPSQYEPCGLPQMYAQQYGTLPVVHETGGLKDSVKGLWDESRDASTATGFLFGGAFDADHVKERLYQALNVFHHKKTLFRRMQHTAIESDFYWPQAIDAYERNIDVMMEDSPSRQ